MVKILRKGEKREPTKFVDAQLEELTKDFFFGKGLSVRQDGDIITVWDHNLEYHPVIVEIKRNTLNISDSKDFETVLELAGKYEKVTGEEWILMKDYKE